VYGSEGIDKSWVKISYMEYTPEGMVRITINHMEILLQFSFPHLTLKNHISLIKWYNMTLVNRNAQSNGGCGSNNPPTPLWKGDR
jgi:hypothetical protein